MRAGSSSWWRWSLVAMVLLVAAAIALWPRAGDTDAAGDTAGSSDAVAGEGPSTGPGPEPPDIAALRAEAELQPCPEPTGAPPSGPLAGITVPCLGHGGAVDLGAALAGTPALLNLWGPQCAPCVTEMPALQEYANRPGAVPVIGVESQELPAGALHLAAQLGITYPSVSDPDGAVRRALGAPPVLPLSYVVWPDGRVAQVDPPEIFRDPAHVQTTVDRYLGAGR